MTKQEARMLIAYYFKTDINGLPLNTIYRAECNDNIFFNITPKDPLEVRFRYGGLLGTTWIIEGFQNQRVFYHKELKSAFRIAQAHMMFKASAYDIKSIHFTKGEI